MLERVFPSLSETVPTLSPFLRDTGLSLHLRTYYLDEQKPSGTLSEACAGGGWARVYGTEVPSEDHGARPDRAAWRGRSRPTSGVASTRQANHIRSQSWDLEGLFLDNAPALALHGRSNGQGRCR